MSLETEPIQLELFAADETLPTEPATVRQFAAVWTVFGGEDKGQRTYRAEGNGITREWLERYVNEWGPEFAARLGELFDGRLMTRMVTCGPWEPA